MKTHDLIQGSPEWIAYRATHFNASDAPAMLGCSIYKTRGQLLQELKTGLLPEVDGATQRRFDDGHAVEAAKRPVAAQIIGEPIYPCVGSDGELSASFDGLTMGEETNWECKRLNDALRAALPCEGPDGNDASKLDKMYRVQMEQQCMVSGCSRVLFTASDGHEDDRHCWYYPDHALRAEIIAGWKQFAEDLANYVAPASAPAAPTGRTPDALPALLIELTGAVTASNLAEFKATALGAIRSVNRELTTDQTFADAEMAVKWCGEIESRIKAAKEHALSQTATIDELFRTLDDVSAEARRVRLDLEKLVDRRKVEIKGELVAAAKAAYEKHEAACRQDAGAWIMLAPPDFGGAIKGKRSVDSMRDALDTCLANAKIAASESAAKIRANLAALDEESAGFTHLFADRLTFIGITPDAVRLMVRGRIAEHKEAEQKRADALAEAARERIRAEEQAKALQAAKDAAWLEGAEDREKARQAELAGAVLAQRAISAPAPTVVPIRAAAPAESAATIRLGELNVKLAPIALTAEGLHLLGFDPVATDKAAKLYRLADFPLMCKALVDHVEQVQVRAAA